MFLLIYSQDILYLVLAFCVLWLTIFIIWFVYYLIVTTRQVYKITTDVKKKINLVDSLLQSLKQKIEHSSSYLTILVDGVKEIVQLTKKSSKKTRRTSKKIAKK